ncbi:MAG: ORF6N domain-containing protein [Verrucomicrobiota bacterium]
MKTMKPKKPIETLILSVRSQKVILDADLAELYDVPTKRLNEQVKRNTDRFPEDFMFQLTEQEWSSLKSQFATSSSEVPQKEGVVPNWSQFATSSKRHRGAAYRPIAFTEHGTLLEHDSALRIIWTKLQPLLVPPPEPPRRRIGFNADDK